MKIIINTKISFQSDESSPTPFHFGIDSSGVNWINIWGRWKYRDSRSQSPSYFLSRIDELSRICLTTSNELSAYFYIGKFKNSVSNEYLGEIGAYIKMSEKNLVFLSNSIRKNSIVQIDFEIETSVEKDIKLIAAITAYKEKNKKIKFEEAIVGYSITSTEFRDALPNVSA